MFNAVFTSPGNDLRDTILADVTVTNSYLTIRPDLATTPAPEQLKHVVVTDTQVTGIAGAAIHYADLRDIASALVRLPDWSCKCRDTAASLTVLDTPGGAINRHSCDRRATCERAAF